MVHLRCDFFSEALSLSTTMTVVLPQQTATQIGMAGQSGRPPPVLYLLHGLSDDDTIWLRRTSIERYVAPLGSGGDHAAGAPQLLHRRGVRRPLLDVSVRGAPATGRFVLPGLGSRDDTFVAGLSMGGYGALKWALRHPERFAAAASLSGAVDVDGLHRAGRPDRIHICSSRIFGDEPRRRPTTCSGCSSRPMPPPAGALGRLRDRRRPVRRQLAFRTTPSPSGRHVTSYFEPATRLRPAGTQHPQVLAWLPLR